MVLFLTVSFTLHYPQLSLAKMSPQCFYFLHPTPFSILRNPIRALRLLLPPEAVAYLLLFLFFYFLEKRNQVETFLQNRGLWFHINAAKSLKETNQEVSCLLYLSWFGPLFFFLHLPEHEKKLDNHLAWSKLSLSLQFQFLSLIFV